LAAVPLFSQTPAQVEVAAGSPATFSAAAYGPPQPTLQWYRSNDNGATWIALAGATGTSYTLESPSIDDGYAQFEVVASNLMGFTNSGYASLIVTATVGQTAQIAVGGSALPSGVATGPDGNVWFTTQSPAQIGTLSAVTHVPTLVALANPACQPTCISTGPDGRMWFTEFASGKLGAYNLTTGKVLEYTAGQGPAGVTTGPNGALWYTLQGDNAIGTMTVSGTVTSYPLPTAAAVPAGIALGSQDSNLWFTESGAGQIGRITPTGTVTEWAIPTPAGGVKPVPQAIVSTADGAVWFTDSANAQLVRFTPAAQFSSVALPAGAQPMGLVLDPSGNLWVADQGLGEISQVTSTGTVSNYPLPAGAAGLAGSVTIGSDTSLYVTEPGSSALAQMVTLATSAAGGVTTTVMPATARIAAGVPMQLSAQVTGSPDSTVVWSIVEGAAGGTITSTGLYTAPATSGTYHVIAASHANPLQTAMVTIQVSSVATPVISVPTYVTANATGLYATIPAQAGCTYAWTVTGGTVTSGSGTNQITFTAGASGYVQFSCTVTNATLTSTATRTAVSTIAAAPAISSFHASASTITPGATVTLTPAFSNGGGVITPTIGNVTSGVPVMTGALEATTTYTLTVTNAAGTAVTAQVLVTVN
jgi:streptogramin lyase